MTTTSTTTSNQALHKKFHPSHKKKVGPSDDQQILQAIVTSPEEPLLRGRLIQIAMAQKGAAGVCFLKKDIQDLWTLSPESPKSGRLPDWSLFPDQMGEKCENVSRTHSIQTEAIPDTKLFALFAPIRARGCDPEILMLVVTSQKDAVLASATIQKMVGSLGLWLASKGATDADWQVMSMAAIVELVGKIEKKTNQKDGAQEASNLIANRLGCHSVAIGLLDENNKMKIKAISGIAKVDRGSETSRNYLQTLVESSVRKTPGLFPATDTENNHLLQAHKQLASLIHAESVFSQPLLTEDEEAFGAIVVTGPGELLQSNHVQRFCDTSAPAITSSLQVVGKIRETWYSRSKAYIQEKLSHAKQMLIVAAIVGTIASLFIPITYRVRCNCITEPVSRRFAVAPFDGQIVVGLAEAGDYVKANDVLAKMDGRKINLEMVGVTAELKQSARTREIELKERNVAKAILSELEHKRLISEEAILEYQQEHLQIRSPIDGVVLSGSLERSEAASVETGEVLFEIGPLKPVRVEIAVPAVDIAQVAVGSDVKVWIDGQEDEPIVAKISKIQPRSETRDADNVFIAEIEFPNDEEKLRPGMKGSARINGQKRSLGWSLFHKPVNWMRSRMTWW